MFILFRETFARTSFVRCHTRGVTWRSCFNRFWDVARRCVCSRSSVFLLSNDLFVASYFFARIGKLFVLLCSALCISGAALPGAVSVF